MTVAALLAAGIASALVALPPPLCRGKTYDRFDPAQNRSPGDRALEEVRLAYQALCPPDKTCGSGDLWENKTVGMNAATWVPGWRPGTSATIIYSADFLNRLRAQFGDGASFGVLAHEVGHHLTATLGLRAGGSHDEELRADYLAGCALGRSGRSSAELEAALRALAVSASPTHPAFDRRNPIVRKGYDECKRLQDTLDAKKGDGGFGIGAAIREKSRGRGCWSYFYRSEDEIRKKGPVAASRRRSRSFASEAQCEAAKENLSDVSKKTAEPCACLEQKR